MHKIDIFILAKAKKKTFYFKMFISWLSVLGAISAATALPVSVFPVRPYVFLAPELPKFTFQPTVKVQSPATVQQIQPVSLTK